MDKPKILIIDDDPGLRKTLADILWTKGYESIGAGDGAEGLAMLKENPVSLVLIDLGLPDISGIEVLDGVKAGYPSTEAIILTGNATLDSAIEATNRGAFSYLLKPYDIDQLLLQIQRALEKQQAEERISLHRSELERTNAELKVLYDISMTVSRTIDLDQLLKEVLRTLTEIKIFPFDFKGAIFLVEGERIRLASFSGFSERAAKTCQNVRLGECLCDRAAANGEIIVSKNSCEDARHTICFPGMPLHGHVVLPLKAADTVVGVLDLYTPPYTEIDEGTLAMLSSVGNQIAVAIENAKLYEETKSHSLHDSLTGLANRRFLDIQMEKIIDSAGRYDKPLSVVMLDIDHFKMYNDTHGHVEGDRLLAKIAGVLLKDLRNADHVFRYGGEEFFVILPDTEPAMAFEAAERVRKAVEAEAGITISIGVASYRGTDDDGESLVKRADEALYLAKQNGRNRVEWAYGDGGEVESRLGAGYIQPGKSI